MSCLEKGNHVILLFSPPQTAVYFHLIQLQQALNETKEWNLVVFVFPMLCFPMCSSSLWDQNKTYILCIIASINPFQQLVLQ